MKIFDTRNKMAEHYFKPDSVLCEIGVFMGEFANELLKIKPKELVLIDPWDSICGSGDVDGNNYKNVELPKMYEVIKDSCKNIPCLNVKRGFSYNILPEFPNNYFDGIYIDGDHSYNGCKTDLEMSLRKIKLGGVIMGHDYEMNFEKATNNYNFGVKEAVDEFCYKYGLSITAKGMDGCVSYAIQIPHNFNRTNPLCANPGN